MIDIPGERFNRQIPPLGIPVDRLEAQHVQVVPRRVTKRHAPAGDRRFLRGLARQAASQHLIEDDTEGVDIGRESHGSVANPLGRGIVRRQEP
jgi:hypothetical protein